MNNFIFSRSRRAFFVFSIFVCLVLSGCVSTEPVVSEPIEPAWMNELRPLSDEQLEINTVNALFRNDVETASRNVTVLLESNPNSRNGLLLKKQIDSRPEEVLGSRFIAYKAVKGESLMDIAERFSGNSLNFYALAKFNELPVSDKIAENILIQVPNTSPVGTVRNVSNRRVKPASRRNDQATPVSAKPAIAVEPIAVETIEAESVDVVQSEELPEPVVPEITEESIIEQANLFYSNQQYAELISLRGSHIEVFSGNPELTDFSASSYMVLSEQSFAKKQMAESASYLNKVKQFSLSEDLAVRASSLETQLQINTLLGQAKSLKEQGQLEQSLQAYESIQAIDSGNAIANKERNSVVNALSKKYYQESIVARGKFDYQSELSWINKILNIDPSHSKSLQRKPVVQRLVEQLN